MLLQERKVSHFVEEVDLFLQKNKLSTLPVEKSIRRMLYIEPAYKNTSGAKDFRMYLRENLLGFVTPNLRKSTRRSESSSPVRKYKSQSEIPETEMRQNIASSLRMRAQLLSYANVGKTEGIRLRRYFSADFVGDSMWICGWSKDTWGSSCTAFYKVQIPEYKVLQKEKKSDPQGDKPTITCTYGKHILFAKRGGSAVFSLYDNQFSTLSDGEISVTAMCSNNSYVYVFDSSRPDQIICFDRHFHECGKIRTELENVGKCKIDMCAIQSPSLAGVSQVPSPSAEKQTDPNQTIILSISSPYPSVRAVNQTRGILWQLDYKTSDDLDLFLRSMQRVGFRCWNHLCR